MSVCPKNVEIEGLCNVVAVGWISFEGTNTVLNDSKLLYAALKLRVSGCDFISMLKLHIRRRKTCISRLVGRLSVSAVCHSNL